MFECYLITFFDPDLTRVTAGFRDLIAFAARTAYEVAVAKLGLEPAFSRKPRLGGLARR